MKYSGIERLEIGRRLYENEISKTEAMAEYGITVDTARHYMRYYRDTNNLPPKDQYAGQMVCVGKKKAKRLYGLEDYEKMSKGELINELIEARINEARLKKGYLVKGDSREKEYIRLASKSTK